MRWAKDTSHDDDPRNKGQPSASFKPPKADNPGPVGSASRSSAGGFASSQAFTGLDNACAQCTTAPAAEH